MELFETLFQFDIVALNQTYFNHRHKNMQTEYRHFIYHLDVPALDDTFRLKFHKNYNYQTF